MHLYYFTIAFQNILINITLLSYLRLILMKEDFIDDGWIKELFLDPSHYNYDNWSNKTYQPSNYWHWKGDCLNSSLKIQRGFIQLKSYLNKWPVRVGHAKHIRKLFEVNKRFFVWSYVTRHPRIVESDQIWADFEIFLLVKICVYHHVNI